MNSESWAQKLTAKNADMISQRRIIDFFFGIIEAKSQKIYWLRGYYCSNQNRY